MKSKKLELGNLNKVIELVKSVHELFETNDIVFTTDDSFIIIVFNKTKNDILENKNVIDITFKDNFNEIIDFGFNLTTKKNIEIQFRKLIEEFNKNDR